MSFDVALQILGEVFVQTLGPWRRFWPCRVLRWRSSALADGWDHTYIMSMCDADTANIQQR